jgi:tRNA(fMet)-specific endonuclease VapC
MESTILGIVLDSSAIIAAERKKLDLSAFIDEILRAHGTVDFSLSPVTVAELVHGIFRAKTEEASARRRGFVEELIALIPVHPMTTRTAWLAGQIEGEEASRGNVLPLHDLLIAAAAIEQGYACSDSQRSAFSAGSWVDRPQPVIC